MEREPIRLALVKAHLTVARKNAAQPPSEPHIILSECPDGIEVTAGPDGIDTAHINAQTSRALNALWAAGWQVRCNGWDRFTVVGRDA